MNKKTLLLSLFLSSAVFLTACSDSGDSSSGSDIDPDNVDIQSSVGTTRSNDIDDFTPYAGTYQGNLVVNYGASGIDIDASRTEPVTIEIRENGDATITIDGRSELVRLTASQVELVRDVDVNYEDINCQGRVVINANLEENNIFGTGVGNGECGNENISTPVDLNANLSLQKQ